MYTPDIHIACYARVCTTWLRLFRMNRTNNFDQFLWINSNILCYDIENYYSTCKKLSLQLAWYYRNIILQRINSIVVLCTRILLLLESLLCWWVELRTMLHHLNRRDLKGITWALLTVYNLQCIIRFSLTLMLSSVKTMASSRCGN